jgi:crossover junction endodeoxyribonuclease RuvC
MIVEARRRIMRILGVDPGLGTTGYGIIEDPSTSLGMVRGLVSASNHKTFRIVEAGVINTKSGTPIQTRISKIFEEISGLIEEYDPAVLVLEKIYSHYKHPTTVILMAHARAMACLVCGKYNIIIPRRE